MKAYWASLPPAGRSFTGLKGGALPGEMVLKDLRANSALVAGMSFYRGAKRRKCAHPLLSFIPLMKDISARGSPSFVLHPGYERHFETKPIL
ncbi:hypothetical protein HMPREF3213_02466 [Heyndrickxia coagulans]|uniref:Uncharacterized protein n=1 Tax=Heyndrickxia coagulans TaxID=1398 RepID=A0A133KK38_HEYCO|nr:hypothetical protein HMPREF3213_02466 [Heyndrickxia coagulans]